MYLLGLCLYKKNSEKVYLKFKGSLCTAFLPIIGVCVGLCLFFRFVYSRFPYNKGLCRFEVVCAL